MDKYTLPFTATINNHEISELDISIPEAIALNNFEASQSDKENVTRLIRRMTIGRKILLERCERYEELIRLHSPNDIVMNEKELIETSIKDFINARNTFMQEMHLAV